MQTMSTCVCNGVYEEHFIYLTTQIKLYIDEVTLYSLYSAY